MNRRSMILDRSTQAESPRRKRRVLGVIFGFSLSAMLAAGVAYALLMATAIGTPESVNTARLSIVLADNGQGFSQPITNMAPADVVNRFVDVTNNGTLDGANLTVAVAASTVNKLSTDVTNGLRVTVSSCSGTWNTTTGVCSGTVTTVLSNSPIASLVGPATVSSGTVAVGSVSHLRVTTSLPDQVETTVNGVLPANSVQSLSNTLTFTFAVTQRAGQTTTS